MGDYAKRTAHLSLAEHGAYRVLLDSYYGTEKPLPADKVALYRICKALESFERKAVDSVAAQFFPVQADGLRHNQRADEELAEAHAYADAQAMRAHKRWHPGGDMPDGMQAQCPDDASHNHRNTKSIPPSGGGTVWDFGQTILCEQGLSQSTARSYIGSLLKEWDEPYVEEAIRASVGKANVKGYMRACLKDKPRKGQPKVTPV